MIELTTLSSNISAGTQVAQTQRSSTKPVSWLTHAVRMDLIKHVTAPGFRGYDEASFLSDVIAVLKTMDSDIRQ